MHFGRERSYEGYAVRVRHVGSGAVLAYVPARQVADRDG